MFHLIATNPVLHRTTAAGYGGQSLGYQHPFYYTSISLEVLGVLGLPA
jgi:hypothetical protein